MRGYLIGGAVAALAIASVAAAAQTAPPPGVAQGTAPGPMAPMPPPGAPHVRMMFGGDHVMTRDEVAKHVAELFGRPAAAKTSGLPIYTAFVLISNGL